MVLAVTHFSFLRTVVSSAHKERVLQTSFRRCKNLFYFSLLLALFVIAVHILNFNHLQVISKKDQAQYWSHADLPYNYISVDQFSQMFKASYLGEKLEEEISKPYDKSRCPNNALSFSIYSLSKWELFKACMARELLLMKRNTFVYIFKTAQVTFYSKDWCSASITMNTYIL